MIDRHLNRLRLAGYRPETIRTKKRLFQHLQYELGECKKIKGGRLAAHKWRGSVCSQEKRA